MPSPSNPKPPPEFDWHTAPLAEAQRRLAELKGIYDRATGIVSQRQQRLPVAYRCWTQTHRKEVPASVLRQCRDHIPDGRWVFKNDGELDMDGHGIVICSQVCYQAYSQNLSERRYRAKLAVAAEEGGSAPPVAAEVAE